MTNQEECKGCYVYDVCYIRMELPDQIKKCPCTTCLVKTMCEQLCQARIDLPYLISKKNKQMDKLFRC